jgi:hypothetical protein
MYIMSGKSSFIGHQTSQSNLSKLSIWFPVASNSDMITRCGTIALDRINTLKFGQLFQIKNKPKLTKLYKFIRVLQYYASTPG